MPDAPSYYDNPLIGRYASPAMCELWGPRKKFTTWRQLWVWLAEAENELGLPVSTAQIKQLRDNIENLDLKPVILRVQTDLFVRAPSRDRAATEPAVKGLTALPWF